MAIYAIVRFVLFKQINDFKKVFTIYETYTLNLSLFKVYVSCVRLKFENPKIKFWPKT